MLDILRVEYTILQKSIGSIKRSHFILGNGSRNIILTFLFLFFTFSGNATSYYISNSGNDSNDGLTPETAWKTVQGVHGFTFSAGDSILLKSGDSFDALLKLNESGTSELPIVITSYGTGAKPILYGDHPNATWTAVSGHTGVYATLVTKNTIQSAFDGDNNRFIKNRQEDGESLDDWLSSFAQGEWGFTWDTDSTYIRTFDDNPPSQIRLLDWSTIETVSSNVIIDGIDVRNGHHGICIIQNATNIIVRNCNVQDMYRVGIYTSTSTDCEFTNNTVTRTGWTSLYMSEGNNNWVHHNNLSHTQDTILGIDASGKEFCGVGLERGLNNLVEYNDFSYLKHSCVDYWLETGSTVRYNKGYYTKSAVYPSGTGLKVYYNEFYLSGEWGAIGGSHSWEERSYVDYDAGYNEIYNNTFYNFSGYGANCLSDSMIYKNNLFIENSGSSLASANNGDFDYNVYYAISGGPSRWKWNDINYYTLGTYQTASSQDANSIYIDPLFTDANSGDFSLQTGSPAINTGTDVGLTQDINGNPIVGTPDIGAYESRVTDTDTEKPTITGFIIPETSSSLVVPISSFTATDNTSVSGFKITESAIAPNASDAGWSTDAPSSYTFSTEGTKTLYGWTKDAAGNVSVSVSDQVVITLPDTARPVNSSFIIPSTSTSLTVSISEFISTDDNGINGYMLTETSTVPDAESENWISSVPTSYTFSSPGTKTLYAWTKDAAGNVSASISDQVVITLPDTTKPVNSSFIIPSTSTSLTVSILEFISTDDIGISGYLLTETSTVPDADSENWISSVPTSYTFSSPGAKTLYAWTKDAAGNVSASISDQIIITLPDLYTSEDISICEGSSYEGWTSTGQYERTLTAESGADSIVTTNLIVNPVYQISEDITILEGESYQGWLTSGQYERTLSASTGCDSIVTTNLSVTLNITSTEYITICEGSSYEGWTSAGIYERVVTASSGADSIVTTNLYVNSVLYVSEDINILEGESYNGWTTSGEYERTLSASSGCDSIITTNLSVTPLSSSGNTEPANPVTINITEDITICEGDSYKSWTTTGQYQQIYTAVSGADSIVTTNLIVNPIYNIIEEVSILEGENYQGWTTSGEYQRVLSSVSGCDSIITTNLIVEQLPVQTEPLQTQTIALEKGWNVISTYLSPVNESVDVVMEALVNNEQLITVEDEEQNTYESTSLKSSAFEWVNTIGNIQKPEGYKVLVESSCMLEITGTPVSLPLSIEIKRGENLISFPINGSIDAMEVIQPLIDSGILEKVQDEKGNSIEMWRNNKNKWINGIGNFNAGEGYILQAKESGVLTISELSEKSGVFIAERLEPTYFYTCFEGNGVDHMNINIEELSETNFQVGDEIAAFDGEICVGAVKLSETDFINNGVSIPVSASTSNGSVGFTEGNPIELRVWHINKSADSQSQSEVVEGDMIYQKYTSVFVRMSNQLTTGINEFESIKIDMYPNPARDRVNLRYSKMPKMGTRIILTDITGKQLINREVQSMLEVLDVQSYSTGMYFVKTTIGDEYKVHKLIKN